MKKNNVIETRYSSAMRLWSVVSSHDFSRSLVQISFAFSGDRITAVAITSSALVDLGLSSASAHIVSPSFQHAWPGSPSDLM